MIHIMLPTTTAKRRLAFYLAMEEWAARNLPPAEYFFSWVVGPTVICGRNQDSSSEIGWDYCQAHGIDIMRRKSGGGCVYADYDNLMLSYITPATDVQATFAHYTGRVAELLRSLGLNAEATGRNDVVIDGRKVSGNAFYHIPGRSIVHGTLLFDTNMEHMLNAITPSRAKLESKQVKSVQSRITTIREHLTNFTIEEFQRMLHCRLADTTLSLDEAQVAEIEKMEQEYYAPGWVEGRKKKGHRYNHSASGYIAGVGHLSVSVDLDADSRIKEVVATGDFLTEADASTLLSEALSGVEHSRAAIERALQLTESTTELAPSAALAALLAPS